MSKTLNIELNVRHMEAQNILTTSGGNVLPVGEGPKTQGQWAPERGGNANAISVRAGF